MTPPKLNNSFVKFDKKNATNWVLRQLGRQVNQGGPKPHEYEFTKKLFVLADELGIEKSKILEVLKRTIVDDSLHGFARIKPHGYAGDFEVIDRIYQQRVSENPTLKNWDRFSLSHAAAQAVVNRKEVFKSQLRMLPNGSRVLNLGCGPCRDVKEFLDEYPHKNLEIVNVDLCEKAIRYSKQLCQKHRHCLRFENANVLRYRSREKFDLIWSAGLIDYFPDRVVVSFLKRLKNILEDKGKIVVGNFCDNNKSRPYMEMVLDWNLIHREEYDLLRLADQSTGSAGSAQVFSEPLAVNLFLQLSP